MFNCQCLCELQERIEAAKRGWELQQQQKLKVEKTEQMILEDEEDLFTYTREDAYNMVQIYSNILTFFSVGSDVMLCRFDTLFPSTLQEYVFENEDGQTEIMPVSLRLHIPEEK